MPLTKEIEYQIDDTINEALSDFNNVHRGYIEKLSNDSIKHDYGKIESYHIITCTDADMRTDIEDYLDVIAAHMDKALQVYLQPPFSPYIAWFEDDGEYRMEIGYTISSDIQFLRRLEHCMPA